MSSPSLFGFSFATLPALACLALASTAHAAPQELPEPTAVETSESAPAAEAGPTTSESASEPSAADPRAPDAPDVSAPADGAPGPTDPAVAPEGAQAVAPPPAAPPPRVTPQPARRGRPPMDPYDRALRKQRRTGLGMTIGGFALLGATYLGSAYAGVSAIDAGRAGSETDDREVAYGQRLLIPIVGPFAAAAVAPSATDGLFTVLTGVAQTASLAVGIAGSVVYSRAKRKTMERLAVTVSPQLGGATLSLSGRF